jgi:hypothetical protein
MGFGIKEGEFRFVAMAIDGKLVEPFWVHESDWRKFDHSGHLNDFLLSQGQALLEQYGPVNHSKVN